MSHTVAPPRATSQLPSLPPDGASPLFWGVQAVALLLWLVALPGLRRSGYSQLGLLVGAGPLLPLAILLTGAAFLIALRSGRSRRAWTSLVAMVLVQRLTITLASQVPVFGWTYKHIGVADGIQATGTLAHGVDIYQGWPGLFSATAWFCDLTGLTALEVAHWFTPVLHLALIALTYGVAKAWRADARVALAAAFLVEALNWVSQDYYSPQATAYLLALGLIGLIGATRAGHRSTALVLVLFPALVVTHQLTPVWVAGLFVLLTLTKQLPNRWLPVVMVALLAAWIGYNWGTVSQHTILSFNVRANAQSNVTTHVVAGQAITSAVVRALSLGIWAAAVLAAIASRRRREPVLALAVVAFTPFAILAGQDYGGEAVFRVFLYALPGCALLLAPWLVKVVDAGLRTRVMASAVVLAAVLASAQGAYGGWYPSLIAPASVRVATSLLDTVPVPAYITPAAPVGAGRDAGRYLDFVRWNPGFDLPLAQDGSPLSTLTYASASDYAQAMAVIEARGTVPTYLLFSPEMQVWAHHFGGLPDGALANLLAHVRQDPRWSLVQDRNGVVVFRTKA